MPACPSCGSNNPAGNKFCLSCGGSLAAPPAALASTPSPQGTACPSCGADNSGGNKFCRSCGKPLSAPSVQPAGAGAMAVAAAQASTPTPATPPPSSAASAPVPDTPSAGAPLLTATQAASSAPVAQPLPVTAPGLKDPAPTPKSAVPEPPPTTQASSRSEQDQPQPVCSACGAVLAPAQKFCLACGTPVGSTAKPAEAPSAAAFTPAASAGQSQTTFQPGPFETPPRSGNKGVLIIVLLLAVLGTAGWFIWKYFSRPDVTVSAFPQKIHVAAGGKTVLQASVSGSSDGDVSWSIQEGAKGGQITPLGVVTEAGQSRARATYLAPQTGGIFHVIVASHANPGRTATVEVAIGGPAQSQTAATTTPEPPPTPVAVIATPANPMATEILGAWRGPSADMKTTIGADSTITMTSDADAQKNLNGTYRFTDNAHLQIDFGNGDVRKWEILGVDDKYLRVTSQSKDGVSATIFARISN